LVDGAAGEVGGGMLGQGGAPFRLGPGSGGDAPPVADLI
jgi:hypothetical protein